MKQSIYLRGRVCPHSHLQRATSGRFKVSVLLLVSRRVGLLQTKSSSSRTSTYEIYVLVYSKTEAVFCDVDCVEITRSSLQHGVR